MSAIFYFEIVPILNLCSLRFIKCLLNSNVIVSSLLSCFFGSQSTIKKFVTEVFEIYLIEDIILQALNNIYISSKFARIVLASRGKSLIENGNSNISRLAYLTGFNGTTNLSSSIYYNIPIFAPTPENLIINYK